ncbi:excalibur calcium-binding domain-containing protein [Terricaulis silvestris]|uniref:excalibur calcium-binding domain-containing protein n=1 Tax=Terricaulis silvestris TaxID=2686094 RepID=UPI00389AB8B7
MAHARHCCARRDDWRCRLLGRRGRACERRSRRRRRLSAPSVASSRDNEPRSERVGPLPPVRARAFVASSHNNESRLERVAPPPQVWATPFRNCAEARAAGAAPVYFGDPGYGEHLDRDLDGVGCEPYPR